MTSGMETLKDVVAAAREREGTVLDAADRSAPYSYREFATNCFKAGNLLGHYGVHPGAAVTVAVGPKEAPGAAGVNGGPDGTPVEDAMGYPDAAEPLLAVFGGASIGATADVTPAAPVDSRALVYPAWRSYGTAPRCSPLAYGGPPEEPSVAHFEAELWSENPTAPPETVGPDDPALRASGETYTHGTLLTVAEDVVAEYGLDGTSRVALSARLTEPGAFVAGVLAPVAAGATILLPGPARADTATAAGEDAPTADSAPPAAGETEPALRVVTGQGDGGREEHSPVVVAADVTASLRDTGRA